MRNDAFSRLFSRAILFENALISRPEWPVGGIVISYSRTLTAITACIACSMLLSYGCSGGGKDPTGAPVDPGARLSALGRPFTHPGDASLSGSHMIWGGYILDIRPEEGTATVTAWDRSLQGHFDVTSAVTKPACANCVRLENFSFDKSAGIIDCDAVLVNPTAFSGYDVRGVLLLDEWDTGRRLVSEDGLTDLWSGDPYHPDSYILFATEAEERRFGPMEEHSAHVTISLPKPYNFLVPFIVDACYPGHAEEPVEIANISVEGTVHPTGYTLEVTADLLDWQGDAQGVYLDCSPLNPLSGLQAFDSPVGGMSGETFGAWTLTLQYDATLPGSWLPLAEGVYELPLIAMDSVSTVKTFQRIKVEVTPDTEPPEWTGEIGIDEVWWGSRRAIVSFFPATDPSGPVLYNIYVASDMPLIPPAKHVATGWSHYCVETLDGIEYKLIVEAEDQAGNEGDNSREIFGKSTAMSLVWSQMFSADLGSSPTVADIDSDGISDVIFGCDDGSVYSLAGDSGSIQWEYQTGEMVKTTPAIRDVNDDGVLDVVVGSNDASIYILNLLMGQPYARLTLTTGGMVESSAVCGDQTGDGIPEIIAGCFDNTLYSFEGGTGVERLTYDTGAPVKATVALEDFNSDGNDDMVVISDGVVRAVDGDTGESICSYDFDAGLTLGSPAVGDLNLDGVGDVVLGGSSGIYALDVANENLLWSNETIGENFDSSPALGDLTGDGVPDVVISSRYMGVYALDGSDGSLIWESDDEIHMPTSPTMADVNDDGIIDVIVGSGDSGLIVLNGADGLTLYSWDKPAYGPVTTIPTIADVDNDGDVDIVFGTESHEMHALSTGHPLPVDLNGMPWPKFMRTRSNTGNLAHPL